MTKAIGTPADTRPVTLVQRPVVGTLLATAVAVGMFGVGACAEAGIPGLSVGGRPLAGATVPSGAVVRAEVPGARAVKFVLDGTYLGTDDVAPFTWTLTAPTGPHRLKVRGEDPSGTQTRLEADFTVSTGAGTGSPVAAPSSPAGPATADGGTPAPPVGVSAVVRVSTVAQLRSALANARPGTVIEVADGLYRSTQRLVASASGTSRLPVTLRGSRQAVLASTGPRGDYGLHVTGSHWRVEGLTVRDASKGIVLDGSVGTVLERVEIHSIGDEGVHFRSCSRDGVLRDSVVRDTGLRAPRFGEGVYVGSASSNWSKYSCEDGRDNSENVLVEGNTFRRVPAEGADLKEGTDSGVLRRNVFEEVGYSGENSADSAVDVKGNGWLIEGNTVRGARGAFRDAFQTHVVAPGYGTGNVFRGNRVEGTVPGFAVGLYPRTGNVVDCTNSAPLAAAGLVGASGRAVDCS